MTTKHELPADLDNYIAGLRIENINLKLAAKQADSLLRITYEHGRYRRLSDDELLRIGDFLASDQATTAEIAAVHPEQAEGAQWHGHVVPRADGVKARCGGPALCKVCQAEQVRAALAQPSPAPEVVYAVFADNGNIRCWAMDRNHGSLKALEVEGCTVVPLQSVAVAQAGQVPEEWRAALQRLEDACDKRSALFSAEAYRVAIQTPGFGDAMSDLDDAREAARDLLAAASAQGGDA